MKKEEIFDKVLEQLKKDYDEGKRVLVSIRKFVKDLSGEIKECPYIIEKLESLGIVNHMRYPDGTLDKAYVALNADGSDWMDDFGNWSGYLEAKDAPKKHGLRITKRSVDILNGVFLLELYNKPEYWNNLNKLTDANRTAQYQDFICKELDWVSNTGACDEDGYLFIEEIDEKEAKFFIEDGMFNYLLEKKTSRAKAASTSNSPLIALHVSQSQTQTQSQSQSVHITIINEAVKGSLSTEQILEIKNILESAKDDKDRRSKVVKWLKSFGQGVSENILANILTNPDVWKVMF